MIFMNIFEVHGEWNIARGKLKQKFIQLSDDDLQFTEGKGVELIGRIQKRAGQNRSETTRAVSSCCAIKPLNECPQGGKDMKLAHSNDKPGVPPKTTTNISVRFVPSSPLKLEIRNPMKTSPRNRPVQWARLQPVQNKKTSATALCFR